MVKFEEDATLQECENLESNLFHILAQYSTWARIRIVKIGAPETGEWIVRKLRNFNIEPMEYKGKSEWEKTIVKWTWKVDLYRPIARELPKVAQEEF